MNEFASRPALDFVSCEREPIHIPGMIQPHGFLLAVEPSSNEVLWASSSAALLLGMPLGAVLGRPLSAVVPPISFERLRDSFTSLSGQRIGPIPVRLQQSDFDAIVHRSGRLHVIEFEPQRDEYTNPPPDLFGDVDMAIERITYAPHETLWSTVADEVRRVTHFDRVMVYRFHDDEHGEVIAEARDRDVESYLHLHYPASDIPAQARQLYRLNWLRLIVDVEAQPAKLVSAPKIPTLEPLDLSRAVLRSVSPIHIQYLKNMDVRASMSVSLVVGDRLWGLIACHHRLPRHLPLRVRSWCEVLARVLSWQITVQQTTEMDNERARAMETVTTLVRTIGEKRDLASALQPTTSLLDLVHAQGVAIFGDGQHFSLGRTPADADILALLQWVSEHMENDIFVTDFLSTAWPPAESLHSTAAGLLALRIAPKHGPVILWFRPEQIHTLQWAGNPEKPMEPDPETGALSPRRSFAIWTETVRGRSLPWQNWEIDVARELRGPLMEVIIRHVAELERLNRELREALQVRDLFLAMASHELRTPVSTIQLQLQTLIRMIERDPATHIDKHALGPRFDVLNRQAARLGRTMDELLDAARLSVGSFDNLAEDVDFADVVREVFARNRAEFDRHGCVPELRLVNGALGHWDRFRLSQVVENLLSNALRYGAGRPVTVELTTIANFVQLRVRDQGIGISLADQSRIFERFQRAVSPSHYQGLGLGLWIARETVVRMGGRIDVHSTPGRGAEFIVSLPMSKSVVAS